MRSRRVENCERQFAFEIVYMMQYHGKNRTHWWCYVLIQVGKSKQVCQKCIPTRGADAAASLSNRMEKFTFHNTI
jgi:hypothetical protein